jgi:hypothetical protein
MDNTQLVVLAGRCREIAFRTVAATIGAHLDARLLVMHRQRTGAGGERSVDALRTLAAPRVGGRQWRYLRELDVSRTPFIDNMESLARGSTSC